ncbi:MAG: PLP-dependent transferase [Flavobacteriales bacterium]|nr:PLP-dependent transferase [Flavobacteriales bacterium]
MKFGTKTIHAGVEADPGTGAIMTPIFQTSTYVQDGIGKHKGYEYSRTGNPTRIALEKNLAALENGTHGLAFASGMSATDAVIKLLKPGDEVISCSDLYGGSYRMFTKIFEPLGIKFIFNDMNDMDELKSLISDKTKMVWVETPTNPTIKVLNLNAIKDAISGKEIIFCVDNTFASPYLQNPLDIGADIVMHSVTKFLGGHSDVIMGALITKNDELAEKLYFIQNTCGAVPSPNDCFLVLRGIKTLHLRMERHCENAQKIAEYLYNHPKVAKVNYPGLVDNAYHYLAKEQMRGFGGMVSFYLKGDDLEEATRIAQSTHYFLLAESLGGVESLIGHPATMTHAAIPKEERVKTGVFDSLLRLSIGIEDIDDLIEDLKRAMG